MRGAASVILVAALAASAAAAEITGARYADPTDIYDHGALPGGEYLTLLVESEGGRVAISLDHAVFEDTAPRLVDLDGDGGPEIVTVSSDFDRGAAIVIFDADDAGRVRLALQGRPIGQRHRWLAISGIADFDGDGRIEIAYVDRPHLARILRIVEVTRDGGAWRMTAEMAVEGVTNHRYGAPGIEGGLGCADGPELVVASADWSRILGFRVEDGLWQARDLGRYSGAAMMRAVCEPASR